jgi:membrane protein DedA with SNARE-associated domain
MYRLSETRELDRTAGRAAAAAALVAVAGLLVFGECTLGLGFVAPGESGLFILGTTVSSVASFLLMWAVTTVCAIAGDVAGYLIGLRFGPRVRQTAAVRRHGARSWDRATVYLRKRGWLAVLVAIFLPVLRTLMPAAAGAARLPLRSFLPAVALGAAAWCAAHIAVGFAAGEAAKEIEKKLGAASWVLLAVIVLAVATVALVRRSRARRG